MFRSLFGKYITAMTAIVIISFVLLSSIAGSILKDYSAGELRGETEHVADLAGKIVYFGFENSDFETLDEYIAAHPDLSGSFAAILPDTVEIELIIVGQSRNNLISTEGTTVENAPVLQDDAFWEEIEATFARGENYASDENVKTLSAEKQFVFAAPIMDGEGNRLGTVLAHASNEAAKKMVSATTQTVVMACLWVMLAMLIAVYFISERLVDRIRVLNNAAKDYAKGRLDVRVDVAGQDEISELGVTFNQMAEELGHLEQKRNQFISDVSHELRSPMMSILGFVDGVRTGSIPAEKQGYYLDLTAGEIKRLSRLVADLLDMSRLEMGEKKMNFEKVDICDTARTVIVSLDRRIEEKELDVSFDTEEDTMFVRADADALHRVIYNLCENAIKFSHVGAQFRVAIRYKENGLFLEVYNEGSGISAEDLPNIFDRFYKSDKSRGLDKKGVGLGLYLVKTIITAHDGTITADSVEGKYCRFVAELPLYNGTHER